MSGIRKPLLTKSRSDGTALRRSSRSQKGSPGVDIDDLDPEIAETANLLSIESREGSGGDGVRGRTFSEAAVYSMSPPRLDQNRSHGSYGSHPPPPPSTRAQGSTARQQKMLRQMSNRRMHGRGGGDVPSHLRQGSLDFVASYGSVFDDPIFSAMDGGIHRRRSSRDSIGSGGSNHSPAVTDHKRHTTFRNFADRAINARRVSAKSSSRPRSTSSIPEGDLPATVETTSSEQEATGKTEPVENVDVGNSEQVAEKKPPSLRNVAFLALKQHRANTLFKDILEVIQDDEPNKTGDEGESEEEEIEEKKYSRNEPSDRYQAEIDADHPLSEEEIDTMLHAPSSEDRGSVTDSAMYGSAIYGTMYSSSGDEEDGGHHHMHGVPATQSFWWRFKARVRQKWKRYRRQVPDYCNPIDRIMRIGDLIKASFALWIALPCSIIAWFLYYHLGNPALIFLPGKATLSWWFNFLARQAVTLDIARITQWVVIDGIMLSAFSVNLFGSLITFFCILSKGWCFVVGIWAVWDLLLMQGTGTFQTHWLFWTGLRIYSQANSGVYILESEFYLRLLVAGILLGFFTAVKRTILAIHFGKRQLAEFKDKFEKIVKDVSLISELSFIAEEAEALAELGMTFDVKEVSAALPKGLGRSRIKAVEFSDRDDDASDQSVESGPDEADDSEVAVDYPEPKKKEQVDDDEYKKSASGMFQRTDSGSGRLQRTMSGNYSIKELLDRWEEPVNKADKVYDATIHDVIKFRRIISFIDNFMPFGEAFGPAGDRDQCIDSSNHLFWRLLKLTPEEESIPFSTIALAAIDERHVNSVDESKLKALRRLFRPDGENMLPMVAFVQSIDTTYKRIRYFRASIGNASVIDNVLERIINTMFFFVLGLVILSFLQINPWPLLVSMTSLLVSVSFALGPSVSKYVEGALLIAVRRPFDLGDRIFFTGATTADNPGSGVSWFVEDINLVNTTLRYAGTNEVSIVSNSSITASRIVNCNRSPNAIIVVPLLLHISFLEAGKYSAFQKALNDYCTKYPRVWDRLLFCRRDAIDADNEKVNVTLAFGHRNSWQDAGRIFVQRGTLLKFIHETTCKLRIDYCSPPNRRLLYTGGSLIDGAKGEGGYKANLLKPWNVQNLSSPVVDPGLSDIMTSHFQPAESQPPSGRAALSASAKLWLAATQPDDLKLE